ncbi:PRC-barrel domain-containing protein [Aquisalimonas lutea]|uniref:PRC-barrel domain-containing protein n=1 Tax=Aquisalimonas lutea TaxID=1327750 RepID=UPI0025B4A8CC|nr:PRC-barrel domain-containing protein [Aquisalimonas lutea]MDN3516266.1 PRC-barrel domain-containing protein [Aquisalimonas lutea]
MIRKRCMQQLAAITLAGAAGWSASAGAAQGLYSADSLLGAPVHDSEGERVGTVDDLLLGDTMAVHSLVVHTNSVLGLGGREIVAERGTFTVETVAAESAFKDIAYEVHMTVGGEEMENLPEYDQGWWNRTSDRLEQAWENTREGSRNAWERAQEVGSSVWEEIRESAESVGETVDEAVNGGDGADNEAP